MNLLFYTRRLTIGGCQINAINLAKGLIRRGHRVVFAADEGPLTEWLRQAHIDYVHIEHMCCKHPSLHLMHELADLVIKYQIDVIQAFDKYPLLEAYGSQLWHSKPVYGLIAAQANPGFRLPQSREIALVNPDTRERYIRQLGWRPDRLRLITARLDCDRYKPLEIRRSEILEKYGLRGNVPVVALVTRIASEKWATIELFLSAAQHWLRTQSKTREVQFAVVGGGNLLSRLSDHIALLGKHAPVHATGEVQDAAEFMNASDIIVGMASVCQQGLACGKPVIVLGEQGFSEIVEPGTFHHLASHHFNLHNIADREQPTSLCRQIEKVLSSPSQAERLGIFGREVALQYYDSRIGAEQLEQVYCSLHCQNTSRLTRVWIWVDLLWSFASLYLRRYRGRIKASGLQLFNKGD